MKKTVLLALLFLGIGGILKADSWVQKANFGGGVRQSPIGFSIGNTGYIGEGTSTYPGYTFVNDVWSYDPTTNVWTQVASFPGTARYTLLGFSIGTKAYIGTGWDQASYLQDFWMYDQTANTWTQKGNFPGSGPRNSGIGFTINNIGYAGLGYDGSAALGDFWKYNDTTDTWTAMTAFGGTARYSVFGFGINGKGYVGCGSQTYPFTSSLNDVWAFDPVANTWTQVASFPGSARFNTGFFTVNNIGYVGMGYDGAYKQDFYQYNPVSNTWTAKANYPDANGIGSGAEFAIGQAGYYGCGYNTTESNVATFYEYIPDGAGINELANNCSVSVYPNPSNGTFTLKDFGFTKSNLQIFDVSGKVVYSQEINNSSQATIDISQCSNGVYFYQLTDEKGSVRGKLVKD